MKISHEGSCSCFSHKPTRTKFTMDACLSIEWPCEKIVPNEKCERRVIQTLHRRGEWGRGRDLPHDRLGEIQAACNENNMTLHQALSMRRTMLRSFPYGMKRMSQSKAMGSSVGQQEISRLLEEALSEYLKSAFKHQSDENIFITESEL